MPQGIRIPLRADDFFDLKEILAAAGDLAYLTWELHNAWFNGDVTEVWPEGALVAEERSRRPEGLPITWSEMRTLADGCQQIIDGVFVGRTDEGVTEIVIQVIDSSEWEVLACERDLVAQIAASFSGVEGQAPGGGVGDGLRVSLG